jgi:hypothetical protein
MEAVSQQGNGNSTGAKMAGHMKVYSCLEWPSLKIGKFIQFSNGFFVTPDQKLQALIEQNGAFGAQIHVVSEAIIEKMMAPQAKVYISRQLPSLCVADRVVFENGMYVTDEPHLQWQVEQHPSFANRSGMWQLDKLLLDDLLKRING